MWLTDAVVGMQFALIDNELVELELDVRAAMIEVMDHYSVEPV